MKKLLFIPRAIIDLISIWTKQLTIKEKSSLTYALFILKIKKWLKKPGSVISYRLFGYKLKGCNHKSLQFLIKEIFIDRIYNLKGKFNNSDRLTFIDIGSNTGLSVIFFKRCFRNAMVDGYEPTESSFELLRQNMEENKCGDVQLYNKAIGAADQILYPQEGFVPCSVNQKFSVTENFNKPVQCVRLTNILERGKIDCIKMDIEGSEKDVLTDVINNNYLAKVRCWLIEFHDDNEQTKRIKEKFLELGFTVEQRKAVYCFTQKK